MSSNFEKSILDDIISNTPDIIVDYWKSLINPDGGIVLECHHYEIWDDVVIVDEYIVGRSVVALLCRVSEDERLYYAHGIVSDKFKNIFTEKEFVSMLNMRVFW